MVLDAILSIGSLIFPPIFKIIKNKISPESKESSIESTISSLATTNPQTIPTIIKAKADLIEAEIKFHNRDVIGEISRWVSDLRASIRPIYVVYSIIYITIASKYGWVVDPSTKYIMETCIPSWFGSRILK